MERILIWAGATAVIVMTGLVTNAVWAGGGRAWKSARRRYVGSRGERQRAREARAAEYANKLSLVHEWYHRALEERTYHLAGWAVQIISLISLWLGSGQVGWTGFQEVLAWTMIGAGVAGGVGVAVSSAEVGDAKELWMDVSKIYQDRKSTVDEDHAAASGSSW